MENNTARARMRAVRIIGTTIVVVLAIVNFGAWIGGTPLPLGGQIFAALAGLAIGARLV